MCADKDVETNIQNENKEKKPLGPKHEEVQSEGMQDPIYGEPFENDGAWGDETEPALE